MSHRRIEHACRASVPHGALPRLELAPAAPFVTPDCSARWPSGALFLRLAFWLRLLAGALSPSSRSGLNQAILEAQSIQVFHGLSRPAQRLFLGLLEEFGAL